MTFPMSRGLLRVQIQLAQVEYRFVVEMTFPMSRGLLLAVVVTRLLTWADTGGNDLPDE